MTFNFLWSVLGRDVSCLEFPKFVVGYKKNNFRTMSDDITSITAAFFEKVLSTKQFDDTQHEIKKNIKMLFITVFYYSYVLSGVHVIILLIYNLIIKANKSIVMA